MTTCKWLWSEKVKSMVGTNFIFFPKVFVNLNSKVVAVFHIQSSNILPKTVEYVKNFFSIHRNQCGRRNSFLSYE